MTIKPPRNIAASVRQKLLNVAKVRAADFQQIGTQYSLERLLYRISISEHRDRLILKGGLLFLAWQADTARPTRDADFLSFGSSDTDEIKKAFQSILSLPAEDGVQFDLTAIEATRIRPEDEYDGVRVTTNATISGARFPIQVDIGFGDAITPGTQEIHFPTLLDQPAPHVLSYPPETVIAEKLEAIISLGDINGRLKDFYDLGVISRMFEINGGILAKAIAATFARRKTDLPEAEPPSLMPAFANLDTTKRNWDAFIRRNTLAVKFASFEALQEALLTFLQPPIAAARTAEALNARWLPGKGWVSTGIPS